MSREGQNMPGVPTVTMYSTKWCGYCHRLKSQMDREGIEFEVVDIEKHPEAASIVAHHNRGNHTVPTLVYSDGRLRPTRASRTCGPSSTRCAEPCGSAHSRFHSTSPSSFTILTVALVAPSTPSTSQ